MNIKIPPKHNVFVTYMDNEQITFEVCSTNNIHVDVQTTKPREHSAFVWLKQYEKQLNDVLTYFALMSQIRITLFDVTNGIDRNSNVGLFPYIKYNSHISVCLSDAHTIGYALARTSYKYTDEFRTIAQYIQTRLDKVYNILRNDGYVVFQTDEQDCHAAIILDYYNRTHEYNLFTYNPNPSVLGFVVSHLYDNDKPYRQLVGNYIRSIFRKERGEPHL